MTIKGSPLGRACKVYLAILGIDILLLVASKGTVEPLVFIGPFWFLLTGAAAQSYWRPALRRREATTGPTGDY